MQIFFKKNRKEEKMFKRIKYGLIILRFGKTGQAIDFRNLNENKGISRVEWDSGMKFLKKWNLVKIEKNKTVLTEKRCFRLF